MEDICINILKRRGEPAYVATSLAERCVRRGTYSSAKRVKEKNRGDKDTKKNRIISQGKKIFLRELKNKKDFFCTFYFNIKNDKVYNFESSFCS
jgi:hypothetical protein